MYGGVTTSRGTEIFVVDGDLDGSVNVAGNVQAGGMILCDGDLTGVVNVLGDMSGDINIEQDVGTTGTVQIGGDVSGDIDVTGSVFGSIDVGASVTTGRILVDGSLDGPVTVGEGSGVVSLIRVDDLGSNGSIIINNDEGNFDASGDIHIGPTNWGSWPSVIFDGCILVKDGSSGGGDLDGDITVVGCHATTDDLNICIDGSINGSITIDQTGCGNTVVASCIGSCP